MKLALLLGLFIAGRASATTITCFNMDELEHKFEVVVNLETNEITLNVDETEFMHFSGHEVEKRLENPGEGFPDNYLDEVWVTIPWDKIPGLRVDLEPGREQGSLGFSTSTYSRSFQIVCP